MSALPSTLAAATSPRRAPWRIGSWPALADVGAGLSLLVVLWFIVAAVHPSWLAPGDPLAADRALILAPPSAAHPFGTDQIGRDVYTRVVHGARASLGLGAGAVALALGAGTVLGLAAGLGRRAVATGVMRLADIGAAFPELLLAVFIVALFGSSVAHAAVAIGIAGIPYYTRVVRAQVLQVRGTAYVEAARGLGLSAAQCVWQHVLPNAMRPVLVLATLGLGGATLAGAALSFLGLGSPPPAPEWGAMLTNARSFLARGWWAAVFPGAALTLFVMCTTVLGQWLQQRGEGRHAR